jgi:hypothetical protein
MGEATLKTLQAGSCLICLVIASKLQLDLEATEFSGGWVTGPLLQLNFAGSILFVLAFVLTFLRQRIAAVAALVASILCLPLYLYRVAPGLFPGLRSVSPELIFTWDGWAASGILIILAMLYFAKAWIVGPKRAGDGKQNSS